MIAIDDEFSKDYKEALYKAQKMGEINDLVEVLQKCQIRLDDKLKSYEGVLEAVDEDLK